MFYLFIDGNFTSKIVLFFKIHFLWKILMYELLNCSDDMCRKIKLWAVTIESPRFYYFINQMKLKL